ncbi:MAG: glycosyltransferase family 4 protein [Prevotella sp.]|nr:glycosyltransferase family 4 protein [Prevotella sp.]
MKVVHIWWSLDYGGIETMLVNIANKQSEEGADVSVVIIDEIKAEALLHAFFPSVRVVSLKRKRHSKSPLPYLRLNYLLWKMHPDVVHLHGSCLYRAIWSRRLSHAACVTLHDLPRGAVRHDGALRLVLPFLDMKIGGNVACINEIPHVFAISKAVRDELSDKYGVNSTVVSNGIITSKFAVRSIKTVSKPFRIVQVSRLEHDKKGQDLLIQAVARMREDVEVDFIGVGSSMDYLQQLAKKLKVESRIHFLGSKTQQYIADNLCQYDLFVQPSRYEGFGLTVTEAMAANIPVLVSAGQGPAEVTCGSKYGWVFENGSVKDLAKNIEYVMNHYVEASEKVVQARQYVIGTYDVAVTARKYMEEYKIFL